MYSSTYAHVYSSYICINKRIKEIEKMVLWNILQTIGSRYLESWDFGEMSLSIVYNFIKELFFTVSTY